MFKVLVVDDDQAIRSQLKNMLDWESMDCTLLALAKDGAEAWNIFQQTLPEVVICETRIPKLDGFTLVKQIKAKKEDTQVIIISAFSDFELVVDMMKVGASDYIRKTKLDQDILRRVIMEAQKRYKELQKKQKHLQNNVYAWLGYYFLMRKNKHELLLEDAYRMLDNPILNAYNSGYQLAYFRIDNVALFYKNTQTTHDTLKQTLEYVMKETIPSFLPAEVIFLTNHSGVVLFQYREKLRVLNTCHAIMKKVSQCVDASLSITLSEVQDSIQDIPNVFDHVLQSHEMRFYVGEGILIETADIYSFNRLHMEDFNFHLQIFDMVSKRDFSVLLQVKDAFIRSMKQEFILPQDVLDYVVFILNNIEGNEQMKGIKNHFSFQELCEQVQQCETIDKLDDVIRDITILIKQWILDVNTNRYHQTITKAMHYIETHLQEKLTLKQIADAFDMNESYLSRTFKKETGKNVMHYINEKKMEKAKEILANDDHKIKDIANMLGMENPFYFHRLFKKYYGISPSEFRQQIQEIQQNVE